MADELQKTELAAAAAAAEVPQVSVHHDNINDAIGTTPQKDIVMSEAPVEQVASSPAPAPLAPSPAPPRTGTPAQGSRATSAHPDPAMPSEAPPHGDSTRRYLNAKVTGVLLEGMKQLAKDQPNDPLRTLGEYLIQRSKELEGTS